MSNNLSALDLGPLPYYVAKYKARTVAIKRDPDYQVTIRLIQKSIPNLRNTKPGDIIIVTYLADYGDTLVQISEETWPDIVHSVKILEVNLESYDELGNAVTLGLVDTKDFTAQNARPAASFPAATTAYHASLVAKSYRLLETTLSLPTKHSDPASITIRTTFQTLITLSVLTSSTIRDVKHRIEAEHGVPTILQQFEASGTQLNDEYEPGQLGVSGGTPLDLILGTRKSAIYVLPAYEPASETRGACTTYFNRPVQLKNINVELSVNREWELAALQPCTDNSPTGYIQSGSWIIDVLTEYTILDHRSGSRMPWIHWDGSPSAQSSPLEIGISQERPAQVPQTTELYPLTHVLEANNSVVVHINDVQTYLSRVLAPIMVSRGQILRPFLSHLNSKPCSHVAIRFLPQAEYQQVAVLSIVGHPHAQLVHVTLLYKRLDSRFALLWDRVPPFQVEEPPTWEEMIDPKKLLQNRERSEFIVVDFTFLEVP